MAVSEPDPPFEAGVVGCGGISSAHGDAAAGNEERVDIVACCDVDEARAEAYADRYGVARTYADYRAMLDAEDLDVVVLATWPNQHEEQVLTCAEAGVPAVLCEKSLSTDAESAVRMVRAAEEAGTLLVEGFMYRHHPRTLRLLELLDEGEVGDLRKVRAGFHSVVDDESNWRRDPDRAGGVVYDYTCYPVNALTAVTGALPERVAAEWSRRDADGLVEELYATVRYPDGTVGQIESSQTANYRQPLEVQGTDGTLYLEHAWSTAPYDDVTVLSGDWEPDFDAETVRVPEADPYEEQLLHLCDCLESGDRPRFTARESVRNVAFIDALLESAETGEFVAPAVPEGFR